MKVPFRTGIGYDIHRFTENRKLILGGIHIPSDKGLDGHSDADCLSHAIADAILGSCGLADIGHYFPNTDSNIKDISSLKILEKAKSEIESLGYKIGNIDCAIIAEAPKIGPYIDAMKETLAQCLDIETSQIGIKATTNEKIGDLGKGTGLAAHATCLVYKT